MAPQARDAGSTILEEPDARSFTHLSDRVRGRLRTALAALLGPATLVAVMLTHVNDDVAARPVADGSGVAAVPTGRA
jgi:hypothetical protein